MPGASWLAVAIGMIFNFCLYGGLFCLALDLHEVHGLGPLATGVAMLPITVTTGVTAFLASRVVARHGEWLSITAGLGCAAAGAVLVAAIPTGAPVWVLVLCTLPIGLNSLAMPAVTAVALADAPAPRVGLASGVLNAARQSGGALGVAVLGALLGLDGGISLHVVFAAIVVAYLVGLALAVLGPRLTRGERQTGRDHRGGFGVRGEHVRGGHHGWGGRPTSERLYPSGPEFSTGGAGQTVT